MSEQAVYLATMATAFLVLVLSTELLLNAANYFRNRKP